MHEYIEHSIKGKQANKQRINLNLSKMLNGKRNSKELGLHWNSEISSNEHESHLQQLYNENLYPAFDTQRMWSSSNFQFEEPEKHFDLESVPFLSFQINEIMSERLYATPSPSIASVEDFFDQNRASPTSDKGLIPLSPRISEHVQSSDLTGILITSFQINKSDVLCGKGGANLHPGNIFFRNLVIHYHHAYLMANSAEKENKIVQTILFEVKRAGGRFLRCLSPFWSDIGERAAAAKTRQALREREPPAGSSVPPLPETTLKKLVSLKEGKFRFHVPSKQNSTSFDEIAVYDNDVLFGRGGIQDSHGMFWGFDC